MLKKKNENDFPEKWKRSNKNLNSNILCGFLFWLKDASQKILFFIKVKDMSGNVVAHVLFCWLFFHLKVIIAIHVVYITARRNSATYIVLHPYMAKYQKNQQKRNSCENFCFTYSPTNRTNNLLARLLSTQMQFYFQSILYIYILLWTFSVFFFFCCLHKWLSGKIFENWDAYYCTFSRCIQKYDFLVFNTM